MAKYIRCHIVEAKPMTFGEFSNLRGHDVPGDKDPAEEGYFVEYPDGYTSWCPKGAFEAAGRQIDNATFGMAIEALKQGRRVTRRGWNGKGMWLWLKPATTVKVDWCHDPKLKHICEINGGEVEALGSICMKTADNKVLTGWLASQTDMLADDWIIDDEGFESKED